MKTTPDQRDVVPHPGKVLYEQYLMPMGISQNEIARDLGVSPRRINEIVLGLRAITADTALRLAQYFKPSAQYWMQLQVAYELEHAEIKLKTFLPRIPGHKRAAA